MKRSLLLFACISFSLKLFAQAPGYDFSFHQIFDNREFYSEYAVPGTIFGARLNGAVLFEIDSVHSFAAGLNYLYEYGSPVLHNHPSVNLYYQYNSEHLDMTFGAFPRRGRIDLPAVFLNDTLDYYRPNIEGASIALKGERAGISGFIDWTGRVSETTRERFMAGLTGRMETGGLFAESVFLMVHDAKSSSPLDSVPIRDNGGFSLAAGYAMQQPSQEMSMEVSAALLASYNRIRPDDFEWGRGVLVSLEFRYTILGFNGVYYFGSPVDMFYGDPFYRSGHYGRLDLFVDPFRHPKIDSKIGWNLHFVPGEGIYHSQQLLIDIRF